MNPTSRPAARAAAAAIAVSTLLAMAAAPAYAKTSIFVTAVPIAVDSDSTLVVVTGTGADDAAGLERICVAEEGRSGPWQLFGCSRVGYDYARTVSAVVPLDSVAPQRFRAELFRVGSQAGRREPGAARRLADHHRDRLTADAGVARENVRAAS